MKACLDLEGANPVILRRDGELERGVSSVGDAASRHNVVANLDALAGLCIQSSLGGIQLAGNNFTRGAVAACVDHLGKRLSEVDQPGNKENA